MLCDPVESQSTTNGPLSGGDINPNCEMICDSSQDDEVSEYDITTKDLLLLCQLFYLPAEHGQVS